MIFLSLKKNIFYSRKFQSWPILGEKSKDISTV